MPQPNNPTSSWTINAAGETVCPWTRTGHKHNTGLRITPNIVIGWSLLAVTITFTTAAAFLADWYSPASDSAWWVITPLEAGTLTAATIVLTLVVHETAHALVAHHLGFGWTMRLAATSEVDSWSPTGQANARDLFWLHLAGPAANLALALLALTAAWTLWPPLAYLAAFQLFICIANLIPIGSTSDGARCYACAQTWRTTPTPN